jgi:hypothetical protein
VNVPGLAGRFADCAMFVLHETISRVFVVRRSSGRVSRRISSGCTSRGDGCNVVVIDNFGGGQREEF